MKRLLSELSTKTESDSRVKAVYRSPISVTVAERTRRHFVGIPNVKILKSPTKIKSLASDFNGIVEFTGQWHCEKPLT